MLTYIIRYTDTDGTIREETMQAESITQIRLSFPETHPGCIYQTAMFISNVTNTQAQPATTKKKSTRRKTKRK